ncbi:MAG: dihydrolipoamide acetyltransferase family protein, partial [Candidatus Acidiferrales bacterium]
MAISVVMPALEMAQETGKLIAWRKKEGERVVKGETLFEMETDKAVVEIEATADGVLAGVNSQEGAVVPVGETIAWIVAPGEKPPAHSTAPAPTGRAKSAPLHTAAPAASTPAAALQDAGISPKARRLANELNLDVNQIHGTGPGGIITTEDVLAAKNSQAAPTAAASIAPAAALSAVARLMAERTAESWKTVPHFFVLREADASELIALQKKLKKEAAAAQSVPPTISDLLIALVARALEKHPALNASWTAAGIRKNPDINISLAMAVDDGVVAPVIQKANVIQIGEIAKQRAALTERARAGRLQPADISGGTFTISNLGMYKVDAFTAIITPPQVAILA